MAMRLLDTPITRPRLASDARDAKRRGMERRKRWRRIGSAQTGHKAAAPIAKEQTQHAYTQHNSADSGVRRANPSPPPQTTGRHPRAPTPGDIFTPAPVFRTGVVFTPPISSDMLKVLARYGEWRRFGRRRGRAARAVAGMATPTRQASRFAYPLSRSALEPDRTAYKSNRAAHSDNRTAHRVGRQAHRANRSARRAIYPARRANQAASRISQTAYRLTERARVGAFYSGDESVKMCAWARFARCFAHVLLTVLLM